MANFSIPIQINTAPIEKPIILIANSVSLPIQLASGLVARPIILGFPEAPTLSEFDYDLDSPMA